MSPHPRKLLHKGRNGKRSPLSVNKQQASVTCKYLPPCQINETCHSHRRFLPSEFECWSVTNWRLTMQPHRLQPVRPPSPSPTPRVHPNLCPLSRSCHPSVSSSVIPFSSCPQSFPASGSFPVSQLFPSGGQSIAVSASASVLPVNIQE